MTSLTEVYQKNAREVSNLRRVYAGTALVIAGGIMAILAVLVATTDFFVTALGDVYVAREYGGILGGLAVPVTLVGVFTVLPSSRRVRAAAAISASICVLGVVLFWYAYPDHWAGFGRDLTVYVSGIYLVGLFSSLWYLFTAVLNFKTRNDPGGALEMNVIRRGRTKVVEVSDSNGLGSVGFLGGTPNGDVETQTNDPHETNSSSRGRSVGGPIGPSGGRVPTSDGGSAANDLRSPLDEPSDDAAFVDAPTAPSSRSRSNQSPRSRSNQSSQSSTGSAASSESGSVTTGQTARRSSPETTSRQSTTETVSRTRDATVLRTNPDGTDETKTTDQYCGNCSHFEYRRSPSTGMVPYCLRNHEAMDDMDACEEWSPNRR